MWRGAILDPDYPRLAITIQQRIDLTNTPMSTVGDEDKGVDKGVRILSLGMHIVLSKLSATTLMAPIKIMGALERIPNFYSSKNIWLDWPMISALTRGMSIQQITST